MLVDAVEKSGERMAVLTTLVGLLMKTHDELEGDEGTGSLEDDMKILEVTHTFYCPASVSMCFHALTWRSSGLCVPAPAFIAS